eukprot:COSAG05_NODE_93_length_19581_cov_53.686685_16_plen_81_part_00
MQHQPAGHLFAEAETKGSLLLSASNNAARRLKDSWCLANKRCQQYELVGRRQPSLRQTPQSATRKSISHISRSCDLMYYV